MAINPLTQPVPKDLIEDLHKKHLKNRIDGVGELITRALLRGDDTPALEAYMVSLKERTGQGHGDTDAEGRGEGADR